MFHYGLPLISAILLWWASTGLIIYLDNLPTRTFRWSMAGATAALPLAFYGLYASASDNSVGGAYLAFASALLAWSWLEISFYMGYVTGPRTRACNPGCSGWRHFGHALAVSLWHELAIVAFALVIAALTADAPNGIGRWSFLVLWWMHESARLNVFLGVRNLNEHFVPEHLAFLKSFLTKRSMNLLFPVSVTVSTVVAVGLVETAAAPAGTPFQAVGFTFLAVLMGLAILEHWFLMLPLPFAALWNWSTPRAAAPLVDGCENGHRHSHDDEAARIVTPDRHVGTGVRPRGGWPPGPRRAMRAAYVGVRADERSSPTNGFPGRRP